MKNIFLVLSVFLLASCTYKYSVNFDSTSGSHTFKAERCDVYVRAAGDESGNIILSFAKDSLNLDKQEDVILYENQKVVHFAIKGDSVFFAADAPVVLSQNNSHLGFGFKAVDDFQNMSKRSFDIKIDLKYTDDFFWVVKQVH